MPGAHWRVPRVVPRCLNRSASPIIVTADRKARATWIATAATLFLAPAGLALDQVLSRCGRKGHRLLAGLCSLHGSNTDFFPCQVPGEDPTAGLVGQQGCTRGQGLPMRAGLITPVRTDAGVPAPPDQANSRAACNAWQMPSHRNRR